MWSRLFSIVWKSTKTLNLQALWLLGLSKAEAIRFHQIPKICGYGLDGADAAINHQFYKTMEAFRADGSNTVYTGEKSTDTAEG